ncbi:hypothetical protein C8J57DRAFT_1305121 [Mycena rebaudengoi]|nr:hypothetical protein C8J57DRAFT_1305121 [Mycena rebaudengoi]
MCYTSNVPVFYILYILAIDALYLIMAAHLVSSPRIVFASPPLFLIHCAISRSREVIIVWNTSIMLDFSNSMFFFASIAKSH